MEENKEEIVQKLFEVLRITRAGSNLTSMEYKEEGYDEYVVLTFDNGYSRMVNVSADSGKAMINDVLRYL
jgi:hypothetical protein